MYMNYGCSCEEAVKRTVQVLANTGYCQVEQNEEMIWTKGTTGLRKAYCIKVEYGKNDMKLLGRIYDFAGREIPLHGMTSMMKKRSIKKTMRKIQSAISSTQGKWV